MNKEKILRILHALIGILTVAPLVAGTISTAKAVVILASASAAKEILLILGDLLDDWQLNKSFSSLALGFLVLSLASGCVQFVQENPDGTKTKLSGFLQKSTFEGLRVSPKSGLSVKSAETQGDSEMIRSIYELGKSAGAEAAKAVK